MSATRLLIPLLTLFFSSFAAFAKDEVHTPHRLMSGRILEVVTNDETGYVGWVLKDRSYQQVAYGDLKDVAFNDSKIVFENPLSWDVKIDVAVLKFSNGRQLVLFVKDRILKRGPEIKPIPQGTVDVRKDFDFKQLRREKKIRVMSFDDPKKPEVETTYTWNGTSFSE